MKSALEELRERRVSPTKPAPVLVIEQDPLPILETFFADDSPPLPTKPQLPDELMQFCYLHRMAATGAIPADKASQVIEAIHSVADMLPSRNKRRLMIEARIEELDDLADWLLHWIPATFEVGEDPFFEPVQI